MLRFEKSKFMHVNKNEKLIFAEPENSHSTNKDKNLKLGIPDLILKKVTRSFKNYKQSKNCGKFLQKSIIYVSFDLKLN